MHKRRAWMHERTGGPVILQVQPDFTHIYTETEFHACLLVHGWRNNIQNPNAYWYSIDLWFKDAWPERHVEKQEMNDHSGQMEFKLQFFSWVRALHGEYPMRSKYDLSRAPEQEVQARALNRSLSAAERMSAASDAITQLCKIKRYRP